MSDRQDITRELERAGWVIYESGPNVFTAAHEDAHQAIKFGGKFGWNLKTIRRQAAEALGKSTTRATTKRHRITAATESAKVRSARDAYLATQDAQIDRELVRNAVIRRTNELRDISRLMQPG